MRKNINKCVIEGYVYDMSKLEKRIAGEHSKHPGTEFFKGKIQIAVDEEGVNIIPVDFIYVAKTFKSGKENSSYPILQKILDNPDKSWVAGGKENAFKVRVSCNLDLNDFYTKDNQQVSEKICRGSFISFVDKLVEETERNKFDADMLISRVNLVEVDPEKNIEQEYLNLNGYIFNYKNNFLPMNFIVKNPQGIKYFMDLDISNANPLYTKVWGRINNTVTLNKVVSETAFGEDIIKTYERHNKEWSVVGTAKVPYEFGEDEEADMTMEDVKKGLQDRELYWADVQKKHEEYEASKMQNSLETKQTVSPGDFDF